MKINQTTLSTLFFFFLLLHTYYIRVIIIRLIYWVFTLFSPLFFIARIRVTNKKKVPILLNKQQQR